jgi:ketosteroid isomerase-like protein
MSSSPSSPSPSPSPIARRAVPDDLRGWLEAFAACVRDVDYDRARAMFDPDVVGFGTFATVLVGRDALVDGQWRNIWGCTRGFRFLLDDADNAGIDGTRVEVSQFGDMAFVATRWQSEGRDAHGNWFDRLGRCTLVLRKRGGGGGGASWLCVHSHYSRQPTPAASAGGAGGAGAGAGGGATPA